VPSSSTNCPTTTPHALEVTLELNGKLVVFIDTPGLAWQPSEEEDRERRRAQDIVLRNKGRIDRLKDPTLAVLYIVSRAETEDLMVFYGLPAFAKGDVDAFLVGIARAHGFIKKVGNLISVCIVASFVNYKPSFFFHYSVRAETPTSLPLHASSCVTGLLARSRGMPSPLQLQVRGPPATPCARRW
jgi:ribosome biogenesis GTPase A